MCADTVNAVDIAMKHLDQALDVYDPSSMASMLNLVSCASAAVSIYFGEDQCQQDAIRVDVETVKRDVH